MKLIRIGEAGHERPAALASEDTYVDLSDLVEDFNGRFFEAGGASLIRSAVSQRIAEGQVQPLAGLRVGPPIARPHQIVCIGLNYSDHAMETGQPIPVEPIIFSKPPNTLIGPTDDVRLPRGSSQTDWEVELGIVIGERASYLPNVEAAARVIAGWTIVNDVSEREFQLMRGGQWIKGKSAETFNPAGPWLVTLDEMPGTAGLELWLDVNGRRKQTGTTSRMIFDPFEIVRYLSQFMVLEPGDLINTGTPPGVGLGQQPPEYLRTGDVIELGISGLGRQRQRVIAARETTELG